MVHFLVHNLDFSLLSSHLSNIFLAIELVLLDNIAQHSQLFMDSHPKHNVFNVSPTQLLHDLSWLSSTLNISLL